MTTNTDLEVVRYSLLIFSIVGVFGNTNIILATIKYKRLQHKCGILLAFLAFSDSLCLINELQSFVRMTFGFTESTLKVCFWANITYIFIEPIEVYLIFALAIDRLIAMNFIVAYRTMNTMKYIIVMLTPAVIIGFFFVCLSITRLDDSIVDPCILPNSMPESVSKLWNLFNLSGAILTMVVYAYTYLNVYCCTFKTKNEQNMILQKAILNTVIIGASIFGISSVLSASLIAITSGIDHPLIDPDTVATYAVIPGLISYSCNFYVYYWRSVDYRNAFMRQLFCGKYGDRSENLTSVVTASVKKPAHVCAWIKRFQNNNEINDIV